MVEVVRAHISLAGATRLRLRTLQLRTSGMTGAPTYVRDRYLHMPGEVVGFPEVASRQKDDRIGSVAKPRIDTIKWSRAPASVGARRTVSQGSCAGLRWVRNPSNWPSDGHFSPLISNGCSSISETHGCCWPRYPIIMSPTDGLAQDVSAWCVCLSPHSRLRLNILTIQVVSVVCEVVHDELVVAHILPYPKLRLSADSIRE